MVKNQNSVHCSALPASAPTSSTADMLIAYLSRLGVEYVFGIPGGAIEPLYNALARSERQGGPRCIIARHETGAAFMADGYARYSSHIGVCCGTTGPGTTNLITGVASAYDNNIPLLVITAQTAVNGFGGRAFQESSDTAINTVGMLEFCTVYNTLVSHSDQFEKKLVTALLTAIAHSRPVHLSVPVNVFNGSIDIEQSSIDRYVERIMTPNKSIDMQKIDALYHTLHHAKKVVFIVGGRSASAAGLLLKVAFKLDAYIVTTPDGKGCISPGHPALRGVIGFAGHQRASDVFLDTDVDTIVAVGTSLGEWSSSPLINDYLQARLIHIDVPEVDAGKSLIAALHLSGDIYSVFVHLLEKFDLEDLNDSVKPDADAQIHCIRQTPSFLAEEIAFSVDEQSIKPQQLMLQLPSHLPVSTKYFADTGNSMAWAIHFLSPYDRRLMERRDMYLAEKASIKRLSLGRRISNTCPFQVTVDFASMGWAIGASIGAAMALPASTLVTCITGDGSMLMNGAEITVAREHSLNVLFTILNDSSLGMVKHGQRLAGAEQVGTELPNVDFALLAQAMGVESFTIRTQSDLQQFWKEKPWLNHGPLCVDVYIDPDEVPPIATRITALKNSI